MLLFFLDPIVIIVEAHASSNNTDDETYENECEMIDQIGNKTNDDTPSNPVFSFLVSQPLFDGNVSIDYAHRCKEIDDRVDVC